MITIKDRQNITDKDIDFLVDNVRKEDLDEYTGLGGKDFRNGVIESLNFSRESYGAFDKEGRTIAIYGIVPEDNDSAIIWCVGSILMERHKINFCRRSKGLIFKWLKEFKILSNIISTENIKSYNWLISIGALFSAPFFVNGKEYKKFIIRRR